MTSAQHLDALTGLPNRAGLERSLQEILRTISRRRHGLTSSQPAVLYIDLDAFSSINQEFGRAAGDCVLAETAVRIKRRVRRHDLVARAGGEEFAVVLSDLDSRISAQQVAQDIRSALAEPFSGLRRDVSLSACTGIAVFPADGAKASTLIEHASVAMDAAKHAGRGGITFFRPELDAQFNERLKLEARLQASLERGEFELHYQPVFEVGSQRIRAFEALVRWRDPEQGLVFPAGFIPVAEECGLIGEIDAWVLNEACRQLREWRDEGLGAIPIAVNVAGVQFASPDFAARVLSTLEGYGLPPSAIELEITESTLMEDAPRAAQQLELLRSNGVQTSIDDFGTGYSSLAYLLRLPVSRVKIDRSFIANLDSPDGKLIVGAIINLAHGLKLKAVAEGIETPEQREIVQLQGCDEMQGYLCGRPMAGAQARAHLTPAPKPEAMHDEAP